MVAHAKFLFDTDFLNGSGRGGGISPADHQGGLTEAEARGYTKGYAAAKMEGTDTERQFASAVSRCAAAIETIAARMDEVETRLGSEAVGIALAVARKLAPALIERQPVIEVAALVTDCLKHLIGVPHVIVRVNDSLYEALQTRLNDIAEASGFSGRLAIIADADLAAGDALVEWADGGVSRKAEMTDAFIAAAVDRFIATRRLSEDNFNSRVER
jgi:flagellar assembly protein FliH